MGKATIDWDKWGKIKTVEIGDACGLLAGIDLPAYRWWGRFCEEKAEQYEANSYLHETYMADFRKNSNDNHGELVDKQKILEVVNNHIMSGCFIPVTIKEISKEDFKKNHPFNEIPEGKKAGYRTVDLAEFGAWAKRSGYELPPEFPIANNDIAELSNNNSLFLNFFKESGLLNGQFFYEYRIRNGRLEANEMMELSSNEYLKKLNQFCEKNSVSFEDGLIQLRDQIIGDLTNAYFKTLYDIVTSRLNNLVLYPVQSATEPEQKIEPSTSKKPSQYKECPAVELIPIIMNELGINPLAYKSTRSLKRDIYNKGKELFDAKYRMDFRSFARGGNSTWNKAKKAGLIKELE